MSQRTLRIIAGDVTATASVDASSTADAVWKALPLEAKGTNVFGRVSGDATVFKRVRPGTRITLARDGAQRKG